MVKLAAYNAARAAIVTRGNLAPDHSANYIEMRARGKLAAFLTLLPVIPGLHGRIPLGLIELFKQIGSMTGDDAKRDFRVLGFELFGKTWTGDYRGGRTDILDVQFVDPSDEATLLGQPEDDPYGEWLSFDDSLVDLIDEDYDYETLSGNVIKVVVTYQYPLVVPIANRIMLALYRPKFYEAVVQDPIAQESMMQVLDDAQKMPIWALGTSLDSALAEPENTLFHVFDRIPIRATYVMRMQSHRAPDWIRYGQMIGQNVVSVLEEPPPLGENEDPEGVDTGLSGEDSPLLMLTELQRLLLSSAAGLQDAFVEYVIDAPVDPDALVP